MRHDAAALNLDDGTLGCAGNHALVLSRLAAAARDYDCWCVVLEDDAVPVEDFRHHLTRALEHAPEPIVGLYLGTGNPSGEIQRQIRQAVLAAQKSNNAWIVSDCLIGSVGYALRASLITPMLGYITDRDEELPLRISRWAQQNNVAICYTMPSLVNHEDGPSVIAPYRVQPGITPSPRAAWNYGTRRQWNTGAVRMGHCPNWSAA